MFNDVFLPLLVYLSVKLPIPRELSVLNRVQFYATTLLALHLPEALISLVKKKKKN